MGVYFYMSPKGEIIKSRRAVMDYMFEDGTYTEKDFYTVISGAKQRKVALQELYEARKNKKTKRSKSFAKEDSDVNLCEEQDEHDIESEEELDTVEDDDEEKIDDAKKCHKKQ